MAAKLQCEICGGKLIGKPGGIFECDSCGMEYDTAWAKAKIQEITGTVKVEGTVEVQGTVKVEGAANKESLLKRGNLALEDSKWDEAKRAFNDALDVDAECGEAYFGLVMASRRYHNRDEMARDYLKNEGHLRTYKDIARAKEFAAEPLRKWFDGLDEEIAAVEEKDQSERAAAVEPLRKARERIAPAKGLIDGNHISGLHGLRSDGSVLAVNSQPVKRSDAVGLAGTYLTLCADGTVYRAKGAENCAAVDGWTDVVELKYLHYHVFGLRRDGTVLAVGDNKNGQSEVSGWTDVVAIAAGDYHTVGLRRDGTVLATKLIEEKYLKDGGQSDITDWQNIIAIYADNYDTVGLRADGSVVVAGRHKDSWRNNWKSIVDVVTYDNLLVGLRADGTVLIGGGQAENVLTHDNAMGETASHWREIVSLCAGYREGSGRFLVGLKADGTVVCSDWFYQSEIEEWNDIVGVYTGIRSRIIGICADGTIRMTRYVKGKWDSDTEDPFKEVYAWKLFDSIDTLAQDRQKLFERAEQRRKARISELTAEQATLNTEFANLKGIFSSKRRKEIETRLVEIDEELKKLS